MKGRVLIAAGSDSGGGAGIQADIKAVSALGGFAATAITALTAQNTHGVFGIHAVPPEFVLLQMEKVLGDIGADCIKTGMLASADIIRAVAEGVARFAPGVPLVVDPVMVAKGGAALLADDATQALIAHLVAGATLITPNIPEAEALLGRKIGGAADMEDAARDLLALGPHAVLLKGGHLDGDDLVDLLVTPGSSRRWSSRRIHTRSTHGTGCTLASATACGLAQGLSVEDAVGRARAYVQEAIATAPGLGTGHGPLNHMHTVTDF